MSAEDCRGADWQQLGFRDGLYGIQRMDAVYGGQCEKHGARVDSAAYGKGWQDGKWEYEKRAMRDNSGD